MEKMKPRFLPNAVPLQCSGHTRPVTHLHYSTITADDIYCLIAACKDNNAILRDGRTGDWVGSYLGHKGAIWNSRMTDNHLLAATGSADFTAKVWDNTNGECMFTLPHNHIVRSVGFAPIAQHQLLTGSHDKHLKLWDLNAPVAKTGNGSTEQDSNGSSQAISTEIGQGVHQGSIKSIVFGHRNDWQFVTACDDKKLRWWDLRARQVIKEFEVEGPIGSCEHHVVRQATQSYMSGGDGVISVAAGKQVYFFDGFKPAELMKSIKLEYEVASVAVNPEKGGFVTGSKNDPWIRVYDYNNQGNAPPLEVLKGHHGPANTLQFSPDGNVFASGSEDGTVKIWKFCEGPYGLWIAKVEVDNPSDVAIPETGEVNTNINGSQPRPTPPIASVDNGYFNL